MASLIPTSVNGVVIPGAVTGPLKALFESPFKKNTYQFPRDLASNPARAHVILFECFEVQPVNLTELTKQAFNLAQINTASATETATNVAQIALQSVVQTTKQAIDLGTNLISNVIAQPTVGQTQLPKETIALFMPDTVNVQYAQQYDSESMVSKLGRAYYLGQMASSISDIVKTSKSDNEHVLNRLGTDPVARSILSKLFLPNQEDLLLRSAGYALNPQLQVFFRQTKLRSFQFDFLLTPYSKDEAIAIKNIIKSFKKYSAPEITKDTLGAGGMYFKMPYLYKITFLYKGQPNENIHKIGTCVLDNISIDYAPNGWATHNSGEPTETRLSLTFQETEIIDRTKIDNNY